MWNYIYQDELYHYGVKGMKWGVKKSEYDSMSKDQKKKLRKEYKQDEKWKKKTTSIRNYNKTWLDSYNKFNSQLSDINKTIKKGSIEQMDSQYVKRFNQIMKKSLNDFSKSLSSPSGRYAVDMFVNSLSDRPIMSLTANRNPDEVTVYRY